MQGGNAEEEAQPGGWAVKWEETRSASEYRPKFFLLPRRVWSHDHTRTWWIWLETVQVRKYAGSPEWRDRSGNQYWLIAGVM